MKFLYLLMFALGVLFVLLPDPDRGQVAGVAVQADREASKEAQSEQVLVETPMTVSSKVNPRYVRESIETNPVPGKVAIGSRPFRPDPKTVSVSDRWEVRLNFEIHLEVLGGGDLPKEVDITINNEATYAFNHASSVPVVYGVIHWSYSVNRPDALDGGMVLEADGFGSQTHYFDEMKVHDGQTLVVRMTLERPASVLVRAIAEAPDGLIATANFSPQGGSIKFGYGFQYILGGPPRLYLKLPIDRDEVINVQAAGFPMLALTAGDLMDLVPEQDGVREVLLHRGVVLTGTVRMEDGSTLPSWITVFARPVTHSMEDLAQGAPRAGDFENAKVNEAGRFEIRGLPAGEISLLVGRNEDSLLAPAFRTHLNPLEPTEVLLEIPGHQVRLAGRVGITQDKEESLWTTLLYVEIYRLESAADGPYQREPTDRVLLGEFQVGNGEFWSLLVPESQANSPHGLLLRAGFNQGDCFERRLLLEGTVPSFDLQLPIEFKAEYSGMSTRELSGANAQAMIKKREAMRAQIETIHARTQQR